MVEPNILIVMADQLSGTFLPDGGLADFLHVPPRKAAYTPWDHQPRQDASERFMRNHMNFDTLEGAKRFPRRQ